MTGPVPRLMGREEGELPAGGAQPETQIGILEVHEEPLVESSGLPERRGPEEGCRGSYAREGDRGLHLGNRLEAEEAEVETLQPPAVAEPSSRGHLGPVPEPYEGLDGGMPGVPVEEVGERHHFTGSYPGVGIEEESVGRPHLAESDVVAVSEAAVSRAADRPCSGALLQGLGGSVGRAVVHDDDGCRAHERLDGLHEFLEQSHGVPGHDQRRCARCSGSRSGRHSATLR